MSDVIFKENTDEFRREFEAALKYNTYKKEYEQMGVVLIGEITPHTPTDIKIEPQKTKR